MAEDYFGTEPQEGRSRPNKLSDFIVTIEGFLAPDLCAALIEEYGDDPYLARAMVEGHIEHDSRTCRQLLTSQKKSIIRNPDKRVHFDNALFDYMGAAVRHYRSLFPDCRISKDTGYLYLRYDEGQFYKQHCDAFPGENRLVTISIALNDDFEGGEWAWFDREIVKRFNTGDAVMFPSNFMFPHEIMPVTKGTRHAVITWFTGK